MSKFLRRMVLVSLGVLESFSILKAYHFDPMVEFAYPRSHVQIIRHQACQAVYAAQSFDYEKTIALLEQVDSSLVVRHNLSDDDTAYLQAMLDHLNHLIDALEHHEDRSKIVQLLHNIEHKI